MKFPPRFLIASFASYLLGLFVPAIVAGLVISPAEPFTVFDGWFFEIVVSLSFIGWLGVGLPWTAIAVRDGWSVNRIKMPCVGACGGVLALALIALISGQLGYLAFSWFAAFQGGVTGLVFCDLSNRWGLDSISED
jgi:hypothetical protein